MIPKESIVIAALDCSFIPKSGQCSYGLGQFWNGKQAKAEKGLEISTLAVIDVDYNTAYHVATQQTPVPSEIGESRMHAYVRHFKENCHALPKRVRYVIGDAYYTKKLMSHAILEMNYHQIGKMRCDANLRYLYQGEQKTRGRPKLYDGKVKFDDLKRFEAIQIDEKLCIYTAVVNCINLNQRIRIAYLVKNDKQGIHTALLFSTDTELDAQKIYRYYRSRFQIEFLFRDAKQFMGLMDCQSRSKEGLHHHFNASFTALNIVKWIDRDKSPIRQPISITNWKRKFFNDLFMKYISLNSDFDLSLIKSSGLYEQLINFGQI